ncbi:MAG: hypothetical protein Tsb0034_16070 [Ekhidna sp.]
MRDNIHYRTPICSYLKLLTLFGLIFIVGACTNDPQKRPSPLTLDSGMVGNTKLKIEYSSPSVRGRKIFGSGPDYLVQYGEMWRTGANDATYITIDDVLQINSVLFDSGSYSIFTIPGKDEWTVIFNKEWKQWGAYHYKDSLDVLRVDVPVQQLDSLAEKMRFFVEDDSLKFRWEHVGWAIDLTSLP